MQITKFLRGVFFVICVSLCLFPSPQSFANVVVYASKPDQKSPFYLELLHTTKVYKIHTEKKIAITVGVGGLDKLLSNKDIQHDAIIATLITKSRFEEYTNENSSRLTKPYTAIFLEPSPLDLAKLAIGIYGHTAKFSVPYKKSIFTPKELFNLDLTNFTAIPVKSRRDIVRSVSGSEAIIMIADHELYSESNIRPIANSLIRQRKGLIGFSKRQVTEHGFLAALYTEKSAIYSQVNNTIKYFINNNRLPSPAYPNYLRVKINSRWARSLGLVSLNEAKLQEFVNRENTPGGSQ